MGTKQFILALSILICVQGCKSGYKTITEFNGGQIAYQSYGNGQKTLVFIHAGGLDQMMWQAQIEAFKKDYTVIAYDIRGHGDSYFTDNTSHDIEDLAAILKQEQKDTIYLVGCSLGSILALDFTINYPEKVEKLVLVSPGLIGVQEKDPVFLQQMTEYVSLMQQGDTVAVVNHLKMLNAIGAKQRSLPAAINAYVEEQLTAFVGSPGLTRLPLIRTINPMEVLPDIRIPSLILLGEWDHSYIHKSAQYLQQNLDQVSLEIIEKAGHLPNLEQPVLFNNLLNQFLSQ